MCTNATLQHIADTPCSATPNPNDVAPNKSLRGKSEEEEKKDFLRDSHFLLRLRLKLVTDIFLDKHYTMFQAMMILTSYDHPYQIS